MAGASLGVGKAVPGGIVGLGLSSEEWQARGRIIEAGVGSVGRETGRRIV